MSGIDDGPPPEVPEEYAAVYRDAYRRALDEAGAEEADPARDELIPLVARPGRPSPARFGPLLIGGLVVLVVCVALGVSLISGGDAPAPGDAVGSTRTAAPSPTGVAPTREPTPEPTPTPTATAAVWDGPVTPVAVGRVTGSCLGAPSVDAAGTPVRYDADNATDGDPTTAWRCDDRAVGETLILVLPPGTKVAELGLIPGYAKTDPASGADRFVENNRVARVRWTLDDGSAFVQELDPDDRAVQRLRIPRTSSGTVVLEILAVEQGTRNRTAISEIAVARGP